MRDMFPFYVNSLSEATAGDTASQPRPRQNEISVSLLLLIPAERHGGKHVAVQTHSSPRVTPSDCAPLLLPDAGAVRGALSTRRAIEIHVKAIAAC